MLVCRPIFNRRVRYTIATAIAGRPTIRALAQPFKFSLTASMSTDEDYASFLDKANQDTGSASKPSSDSKFASTKAVDTYVPAPLQSLGDAFYVSDTDEPFEPVALGHTGKEIDKRMRSQVIERSRAGRG